MPDPNARAKDEIERELLRLLKEALGSQFEEILRLLGDPPDLTKLPPDFWTKLTAEMAAKARPILEKAARQAAKRMIVEEGIGVDWTLVAEDAARWASQYSYELVTGITNTTQRILRDNVARFIQEPGRTIGDLAKDLEPCFGKMRAQMIGVTETTRAFSEGTNITQKRLEESDIRMTRIWNTCVDEIVCPVCGPLEGKPETEWANNFPTGPPAHPNCRCWATLTTRPEEAREGRMTYREEAPRHWIRK